MAYSLELMLFPSWFKDTTFHTHLSIEIMQSAFLNTQMILITLQEDCAFEAVFPVNLAFGQNAHDGKFVLPASSPIFSWCDGHVI